MKRSHNPKGVVPRRLRTANLETAFCVLGTSHVWGSISEISLALEGEVRIYKPFVRQSHTHSLFFFFFGDGGSGPSIVKGIGPSGYSDRLPVAYTCHRQVKKAACRSLCNALGRILQAQQWSQKNG